MSTNNNQRILRHSLLKLLRPLARILLHRGISAPELCELVRKAYVDVAESDFTLERRKQTTSRIAVLTGLNRIEVARLREAEADPQDTERQFYNRAARVVSGWTLDPRFAPDGIAADLPWDGENSFSTLVAGFSGGMPARAVLDELKRVGTVRETEDGLLHLCAEAYIPVDDDGDKLRLFGIATSDLLGTLDHNLNNTAAPSRFQLSVYHDQVTAGAAQRFRELSDERSMQLLKDFDAWLEQHAGDDANDIDPTQDNKESAATPTRRVGVGIYFFEDQESPDEK
jgi:hypothetical protein